ncbi:hypothetical protein [Paraburkholderia unamae]|uniref:Uncharacterized protein n=1 Tax=Paraburkholderia unamae TaxID=219649 RepID=A0ACC6RGL3_9BURK
MKIKHKDHHVGHYYSKVWYENGAQAYIFADGEVHFYTATNGPCINVDYLKADRGSTEKTGWYNMLEDTCYPTRAVAIAAARLS